MGHEEREVRVRGHIYKYRSVVLGRRRCVLCDSLPWVSPLWIATSCVFSTITALCIFVTSRNAGGAWALAPVSTAANVPKVSDSQSRSNYVLPRSRHGLCGLWFNNFAR